MKHRIAIVDDHPLISEGIHHLLSKSKDLQIVGNFLTGQDFIQYITSNVVDLVLLDISLPDIDGMDLCLKIRQLSHRTVILALSNHTEKSAIMGMLQNGANGYILKNTSNKELTSNIYKAIEGQIVFSKSIQEIITNPDTITSTPLQILTTREKEILQLIAEGYTGAEVGAKLFISKFTVENHRKNILQKMGVNNTAALINEARKNGLL